jgi:hypothetical protein
MDLCPFSYLSCVSMCSTGAALSLLSPESTKFHSPEEKRKWRATHYGQHTMNELEQGSSKCGLGLATLASPGNLLDMQPQAHRIRYPGCRDQQSASPSRWFWCQLVFENQMVRCPTSPQIQILQTQGPVSRAKCSKLQTFIETFSSKMSQ